MVRRSRAHWFCRVTWARDVTCLCSQDRDSAVESKAIFSLPLRSSTAHRECPKASPERPIPAADAERDIPTIMGRKAAQWVLE